MNIYVISLISTNRSDLKCVTGVWDAILNTEEEAEKRLQHFFNVHKEHYTSTDKIFGTTCNTYYTLNSVWEIRKFSVS